MTQVAKDLDPFTFEVFYNRLDAFMKCAALYLLVFILGCLGWLLRRQGLVRAAVTIMACAAVPHTFAIVARIFLSGYPPVTNLYSSAIFIGWAAVIACIAARVVPGSRHASTTCARLRTNCSAAW